MKTDGLSIPLPKSCTRHASTRGSPESPESRTAKKVAGNCGLGFRDLGFACQRLGVWGLGSNWGCPQVPLREVIGL